MDARKIIFQILTDFEQTPTAFERIVDRALASLTIDHRDRRFIFEIVNGVVRRRLTLDYHIERLLDNVIHKKNPALRRILAMGLYQIAYMDRVPSHAAVNESVNLAKSVQETKNFSGVVNGVLRKIVADRRSLMLPDAGALELGDRLSIEYSHPRWLVDRWLAQFGLSQTKQLLTFNNTRPETYLRRKIHGLGRHQFEADIHNLCDSATGYLNLYYRLKKALTPEFLAVIRQGLCAIQSPSSGWVAALMEAANGEKILDVCSAPGGKTAIMAEQVGARGSVCACDNRFSRIVKTRDTATNLRIDNVYLLVCDGVALPFTGRFDKVLIDAPCSATGVFHRHPEARWTRTLQDIQNSAKLQRSLLDAAAACIGRGGIMVYSTCSIEPEENSLLVKAFLKDHPEFMLDSCPGVIPQTFVDSNGFLSITPFAHGMDGMFGARLRKVS